MIDIIIAVLCIAFGLSFYLGMAWLVGGESKFSKYNLAK